MPRSAKPFDQQHALKLYGDGLTIKQVAARVGGTYYTVRELLKREGKLRRKGGKPQIDEAKLVARYAEIRSSEGVAAEFDCTSEYVLKLVRAAGGEVAPRGGRRIYAFDETLFDTYTAVSCYWAGFLAADGCLVLSKGAHRIQVGPLARSDREHLEAFRRSTGTAHPVYDIVCAGVLESQLIVSSRRWWGALHERFNLEQRKSLTLQPPPEDIPEEMLWHYVRGYFDGDGGVGTALDAEGRPKQINFNCASRPYIVWVRRFLGSGSHHKLDFRNNCWRFYPSGPVLRRAVPKLYAGSTPDTRLARKYDKLTCYL